MPREIERKYFGADIESLRDMLRKSNAVPHFVHWETNIVFETNPPSLIASKRTLRLRTQTWRDARPNCHILTLKLPVKEECKFKVREELEIEVDNAATTRKILEGLGYAEVYRYEKIRETWTFGGVEVDIDILPFCIAVELEGPQQAILHAETFLGLAECEKSTKSYRELHKEWREKNGLSSNENFVFTEDEKKKWLKDGLVKMLRFVPQKNGKTG